MIMHGMTSITAGMRTGGMTTRCPMVRSITASMTRTANATSTTKHQDKTDVAESAFYDIHDGFISISDNLAIYPDFSFKQFKHTKFYNGAVRPRRNNIFYVGRMERYGV